MKKIDIAIILAGSLNIGKMPGKTTRERLDGYLKFSQLKKITPVIVSGKGAILKRTKSPYTLADSMKFYLINNDVPNKLITKEERSLDTITNAYYSKRIVIKKYPQARHILLITSDTHMRRSLWIFKKIFGPDYSFISKAIPETDTPKLLRNRQEYEQWLLDETKKILAKAPAGNDHMITTLLRRFHPQFSRSKQALDFYQRAKIKKDSLLGTM